MFQIPPILEDVNSWVQDYLLQPEKLKIHKWERSQTHWHRKPNIDSLFLLDDDDENEPDTTLEVIMLKKLSWLLH